MARFVWYAAYGSNMSHARFLTYLRGGRPPGAGRPMRGARDPADPVAEAPCALRHRLRFGGESKVWGGGVAFIDADADADADGAGLGDRRHHTLGRRYLITTEQFVDVLAQESGRPVGDDVDLGPVLAGSDGVVGTGRYDHVIPLGQQGGHPVLTFTRPAHAWLAPNPPSTAYAATIVRGITEAHDLTVDEAHEYVRRRASSGSELTTDDRPGSPS